MKHGATTQKSELARVEEHDQATRCDDQMPGAFSIASSEESQQAQAFDVVLREARLHVREKRIEATPNPEPAGTPPTAEIVRELYATLKRRWERSGVR